VELGVQDRPRLHVFNKIDRLPAEEANALANSCAASNGNIFVSALSGTGLDELLARIDAAMPVDPVVRVHLRLPLEDGRSLAMVHACGRVLDSAVSDGHLEFDAEIPESLAKRFEEFSEKTEKADR
jgi:GTP-binding protein HflX